MNITEALQLKKLILNQIEAAGGGYADMESHHDHDYQVVVQWDTDGHVERFASPKDWFDREAIRAARILGARGGAATRGVSTPAKTAAARKNAKLGGRPPANTIRVKGEAIEVVRKVHAGLKPTHNIDGRYNLVWAITADGKIYRTHGRKGGTWREARAGEKPPAELRRDQSE